MFHANSYKIISQFLNTSKASIIAHYEPISSCNTLYILIPKVLCNKIESVIGEITGPDEFKCILHVF